MKVISGKYKDKRIKYLIKSNPKENLSTKKADDLPLKKGKKKMNDLSDILGRDYKKKLEEKNNSNEEIIINIKTKNSKNDKANIIEDNKSLSKKSNKNSQNDEFIIRPTAAKVRDAIFNKFQFDLEGKVLVDLFSGTGAIGIEGLSRGLKKVHFVDNSNEAISLIKENTSYINKDDFEIYELSYKRFIDRIDFNFDYIYIDPPYDFNYYDILDKLLNNEKINFSITLIIERSVDKKIDYEKYRNLKLTKSRKFGKKAIDYLYYDLERVVNL